jgi:hypothetical protein
VRDDGGTAFIKEIQHPVIDPIKLHTEFVEATSQVLGVGAAEFVSLLRQ